METTAFQRQPPTSQRSRVAERDQLTRDQRMRRNAGHAFLARIENKNRAKDLAPSNDRPRRLAIEGLPHLLAADARRTRAALCLQTAALTNIQSAAFTVRVATSAVISSSLQLKSIEVPPRA
jgi:hypothetical protein